MTDTRIAYGARCGWWGPIQEVGTIDGGVHRLPCCPVCRGMLFEVTSLERWNDLLEMTEAKGYPGYKAKMEWARDAKLHFFTLEELNEAYERAHQ